MKRRIRTLTAAVLLALAPLAAAQDPAASPGQSLVASRLATSFTNLAGSRENAVALVTALRNGSEVTLLASPEGGTGDPVATTFAPPTRPMGWGNVSHSLSLAQASLARMGITNPTNAELQAALLGGEVTAPDGSVATLDGILQMRADGMGWGAIARSSGTTMGAVVSSTRAMQGKAPAAVSTATGEAGAGGKAPRGLTTAAGASVSQGRGPSKGVTATPGVAPASASRGMVTADGSLAGHGRSGSVTTAAAGAPGGGSAYGRGLVTASGGSAGAGAAAAAAHGRGAGVVAATGASAGSGASITSAAGPGNGHGQGGGNGNGQGRGRGG